MALCHVATVISLGAGRTLVDDSNSSLYLPPVGRQNFPTCECSDDLDICCMTDIPAIHIPVSRLSLCFFQVAFFFSFFGLRQ